MSDMLSTIPPQDYNLDSFVGREEELSLLMDYVTQCTDTPKLVFVEGVGGVGKTTLLKKFITDLKKSNRTAILYDFDDFFFHSSENLRRKLIVMLGVGNFPTYQRKFEKLSKEKEMGSNPNLIRERHEEASIAWRDDFEKNISHQCPVIVFDTVDALSDTQIKMIAKHFLVYMPKNVLVIMAGRSSQINRMKNFFEHELSTVDSCLLKIEKGLEIKGFSSKEVEKFIDKKLKEAFLYQIPYIDSKNNKDNYREIIIRGSRCLPILIDLTLEILLRPNDNIRGFIKILEELQSSHYVENNEKLHCDFKKSLTMYFLNMHSNDLRQLVLILAHTWPLGNQGVEEILNYQNDDEVRKIVKRAFSVSYIKSMPDPISYYDNSRMNYLLKLQDVMREMINKYAWELEDIDKNFRIKASENFLVAIRKVLDKISGLSKTLIGNDVVKAYSLELFEQQLKIQEVRHETFLNPIKGIGLFIDYFEQGGKKDNDSLYIGELMEQVDDAIMTRFDLNNILDLIKINIEYIESIADFLSRKLRFFASRNNEKTNDIESDLMNLSRNKEVSISLKAFIDGEIAANEIKQGHFIKGRDKLRELQRLCEDNDQYKILFDVFVSKGWVYRLMGDFNKADENYADAYQLLIDHQDKFEDFTQEGDKLLALKRSVATLFQTWAYVTALKHDQSKAEELANQAKEIFKQIDFLQGEGRVESVLGRIKIEFNQHDAAIRHFEKALGIIPNDDKIWQSKILLGMAHAYILRMTSMMELSMDKNNEIIGLDIKNASLYLDEAEKLSVGSDVIECLYLQGLFSLKKNDFNRASDYFDKCKKCSIDEKSLSYFLKTLIGEARIAINKSLQMLEATSSAEIEEELSTWSKIFIEKNEEQEDKLSLAILRRTLADLKFLEASEFDHVILEIYKETLPVIGDVARFYPNDLRGQLGRMQEMFELYAQKTKTSVNDPPEIKYDNEKIDRVRRLAVSLADAWRKDRLLTRNHPNAYAVIRSWCSGDLSAWNVMEKTNHNYGDVK